MRTQESTRSRRIFLLAALCLTLAFAPAFAGDGADHSRSAMKGRILQAQGNGVYLCIGSTHGAAPGQVLDVVKVVRWSGGTPKGGVRYLRRHVGRIRIDTLDGHFAHATVVQGESREGYLVKLAG
jgi:hypothetical protein